MNPGDALIDIPDVKVLQVARKVSGLTLAQIATAMQRDPDTVGGWFAESADRFPPLPLIPKLCHVLGDPLIIEWLYAQYRQLCEGDPTFDGAADAERTRALLIRAVGQVTNALNLARDLGPTFTTSESKQVSAAILLAVATLASASREAVGRRPAPVRRLSFLRDGDVQAEALPRCSWWRRLIQKFSRAKTASSFQELPAVWVCDEPGKPWRLLYGGRAELLEACRIIKAMGQIIQEAPALRPEDRATSYRLLAEGEAFAARVGQG